MFHKILVPVDLTHATSLAKTLRIAGDLARQNQAELCFVGVASSAPSAVARTPDDYEQALAEFAAAQAKAMGVSASSEALIAHDPAVQLNHLLEATAERLGADLVVMATHMPGVTDYIWSGHGAHMAAHAKASVFLVRG